MTLHDLFVACTKGPWTTSGKDVQFRIDVVEDTLRVYFQGSVSVSDWWHNANTAVAEASYFAFKAHRGFIDLYESVKEHLHNSITMRMGIAVKRAYVAGYSQGAALALLCSKDPFWDKEVVLPVVGFGFGCPRVCIGKDNHQRFDNFTRINLRCDPVPHLPPAIMGFRHVGRKIVLGGLRNPLDAHRVTNYEQVLRVAGTKGV